MDKKKKFSKVDPAKVEKSAGKKDGMKKPSGKMMRNKMYGDKE